MVLFTQENKVFSTNQKHKYCKQMNKIVGSPITRGQANEGMNQTENTLKKCGVDPQTTMKKMLNKKAFETMVINWVKENANAKVLSDMFEETEYAITTNPTGNGYTVAEYAKSLKKENKGLFDYVDNDITNWFGKLNFASKESVSGRVQLFKNDMTHRQIITEGENMGIYEEYALGDALLLANELVKAKAIEKPGYGVIIYLKERKGDTRCRLIVYCNSDCRLRVLIYDVDPDVQWHAGHGVLFSN